MIHDLYLRAHIVVSPAWRRAGRKTCEALSSRLSCGLITRLFGIRRRRLILNRRSILASGVSASFRAAEYVAVQEGIFYRDGLGPKDIQTILAYKQKYLADGLASGADRELTVLSRAAFVERIFWESVRAGALIVGFNLPFDISRIAVHWATAHNGGFSFVLSQLSKKQVENLHRPRIRIAPLNGVAEQIELTAVRRKNEQHRWRRGRFLDLHTLAFALTDNSYSLAGAIEAFGSTTGENGARTDRSI